MIEVELPNGTVVDLELPDGATEVTIAQAIKALERRRDLAANTIEATLPGGEVLHFADDPGDPTNAVGIRRVVKERLGADPQFALADPEDPLEYQLTGIAPALLRIRFSEYRADAGDAQTAEEAAAAYTRVLVKRAPAEQHNKLTVTKEMLRRSLLRTVPTIERPRVHNADPIDADPFRDNMHSTWSRFWPR